MITNRVRLKIRFPFVLVIFLLLISGCGEDSVIDPDGDGNDPEEIFDEWSFPVNYNFEVSLYSDVDTVAVADTFDVKIVFYNIRDVLGMGLVISYDSDLIEISSVIPGPYFSPESLVIALSLIEPDINRISYGASFIRGSQLTVSNSGIVAKLRCVAKKNGLAKFSIIPGKYEIIGIDGKLVSNFRSLTISNSSVIVE